MLQLDAGAETEAVTGQLERAIELYDRAGDVEHVQIVGEMLRDLYKKSGDFGRYRLLRERFRALESRAPGIDPLGLELRIEHLLSLARQEQNEERAIEMVERCVRLFGRMPDSTTRIDECFVEISKICRRRADEAQTEEGFQDWLRRSLEAVRVATGINRSLGNFHRVFEEMHEMFDDLVGMGAFDEYVAARAEGRDLAFAVGQVPELLTLFDEHLQLDPDSGFDTGRLPEVRGFFEALLRYLLGLGARTQALSLQRSFTSFLTAVGEHELSDHYRRRPPLAEA
jgi:tetratricopeptide (TPR) repeat protein